MNLFDSYRGLPGVWDELFDGEGRPRPGFGRAVEPLDSGAARDVGRGETLAERAVPNQGVTFCVYSDARGTEKVFRVCLRPGLISAVEWWKLEEGLGQRLRALSMFLDDVYGEQRILAEGRIPRELVLGAKHYLPILRGSAAPGGVRIHVSGIDLIRDPSGTFRVLEDNLRTPSGVSYVLENRVVTKRVMPRTVDVARVQRVEDYPARLAETLVSVSPVAPEESTTVVLTPGPYNSAYFEHSFLARTMGLELVEEPLLEQVGTWVCFREDDRQYVLEHLPEMVVKAVDEAGGYGMLIGPQASAAERDAFRAKIQAEPRRYVAQRLIELSTCPTWDKGSGRVVPRRVDLRPYSLFGKNGAWVLPGGLTRVALVEGSYVVNSSQGGGSKDTWVMKP